MIVKFQERKIILKKLIQLKGKRVLSSDDSKDPDESDDNDDLNDGNNQ